MVRVELAFSERSNAGEPVKFSDTLASPESFVPSDVLRTSLVRVALSPVNESLSVPSKYLNDSIGFLLQATIGLASECPTVWVDGRENVSVCPSTTPEPKS